MVRPPCLTTFKSPCQTPIPDLSNIYCQSPPQLLPRSSSFPAGEFPFDANPSLVYALCCSNCTVRCLLLLRNPHFPQDSAAPNQQQQSIARENKSQRFQPPPLSAQDGKTRKKKMNPRFFNAHNTTCDRKQMTQEEEEDDDDDGDEIFWQMQ